ncbi:MAG: pitrilysin family protein [Bacillota bacterium]
MISGQFSKIDYPSFGETLFHKKYSNGFSAYFIKKKGFTKMFATIGTRYGSIDNCFSTSEETTPICVPDGIAHFLEHKLFEQKDSNVLQKFAALGANPNAYTSFDRTAYHFTCTENFYESFDILLEYVRNPYFTDDNVEKEKGIIAQEIDMYLDNPDWMGYFCFLRNLYQNHPIRLEIAGSKESIAKIDKELLYKCHNTFYNPSNMILVVAGDLEEDLVFSQIAKTIGSEESAPLKINRIIEKDSEVPFLKISKHKFDVGMPRFLAGYKESAGVVFGMDRAKREIGIKLLYSMILGRSSDLYEELYEEGLINGTISSEYMLEDDFSFSCISGDSIDAEKVVGKILQKIAMLKKNGLDNEVFQRVLKARKGRNLRSLDSVESFGGSFFKLIFNDCNLFEYFELYDKITIEYLEELLNNHFDESKFTLTKIEPL